MVEARNSDGTAAERLRRSSELGRLLAAAAGYRVITAEGARIGSLNHVRYQRHADHPDEIVLRSRSLLRRRRRRLPFGAVDTVRPADRTVIVHSSFVEEPRN